MSETRLTKGTKAFTHKGVEHEGVLWTLSDGTYRVSVCDVGLDELPHWIYMHMYETLTGGGG